MSCIAVVPRIPPPSLRSGPHPALRATFSREAREKTNLDARFRFNQREIYLSVFGGAVDAVAQAADG